MNNTPSVRLGRIADVRPSSVDKKTVEGQEPVLLCNYTDIYYSDEISDRMRAHFMEATAKPDQIERFTLQADDVLITKDSETPDDIGIPAWVSADLPGVILGYHTALVRPRPGSDGRYIYWALRSHPVRDHFFQFARGVTRFALRVEDITHTPIPLHSLERQRRIAQFLDADAARLRLLVAGMPEPTSSGSSPGLLTRQVQLLRERQESLITAAVTGQLDLGEAA